jgi:hypothetical protein
MMIKYLPHALALKVVFNMINFSKSQQGVAMGSQISGLIAEIFLQAT